MAKIYTLECILNKLDLKGNKNENPEILGKGKCGDLFNFTISYYDKRSAFNVFTTHSGHGTSILFSCTPNSLIAAFTKDFKLTLENSATKTAIGTVKMTFDNTFVSTVQKFSDTSNIYKFEKSLPVLNSSSAEIGTLSIKGCLVYHGNKIEVPMNNFPSQMIIPMPKRDEGRGQSRAQEEWRPVFTASSKPARSLMDSKMEIFAEMAGVQNVKMNALLTPEYICKNLCGHIACPGARKFKEYGLGPLAAGGGLGTITTVKDTKPNGFYGMSQAYGTLDNYGAYGLFVQKPKKKTKKYCCGSPDCPYTAFYGLKSDDPGFVEVGEDYIPPPTPPLVTVCQCKKCQRCCKNASKNGSKSSSQDSTCGGPLCPQKKQPPGTESIGKPCPFTRQAAGSDCEKFECPNLKQSRGQSVRPSNLTSSRQLGFATDDCRQNACPDVCNDSPDFLSSFPTLPVPTRYTVPSDDCGNIECPHHDQPKRPIKSSLKRTSISSPMQPPTPLTRVQVPQADDCRDDCPILKSSLAKPKTDDCRDDCPILKSSLAKPKTQDCRDDCPILKSNLARISELAAEMEEPPGLAKEDYPHIRLPETMPPLPVPTRFEGPFLSSDDDTSIRKRDNICEGLECPYHVGSGLPGTCPMGTCPLLTCGNKRKLSPRVPSEEIEGEITETDSAPEMKKKGPPDKKKKVCPSKLCWKFEEPKPEEGPCGGFVCPSDKKKRGDSRISPVASGDAYIGPTERMGGDTKSKRLSLLVNEEGKQMLIKESLNKLNNRQRDILGSLQLKDNTDGYFMISRLLASRQPSSMNNYLKAEKRRSGPCTRASCKSLKYKTCSECGGMSRSGATCDETNVSFSTVSYESIQTLLATRKTEIKAKQKKEELALQHPPVKFKKKKAYNRFVYTAGENYPGVMYGHRTCNLRGTNTNVRNVPAHMGWLWNIRRDWEKRRIKNWKPGYLNKIIEDRIIQYRRARGIPDPPELKMLVRKKFTMAAPESEEEEEPVIPKPTLTIEKKEGNYLVTMNPLKDPKTLVDREDPYMRCKPIQFLITKQKKVPKPPVMTVYDEIGGEFEGEGANFDYRCLCDENEDMCSTSSSDSELNIEFTTPAGLIDPERMKRPPNVVMVNTQFKAADFNCEDCPIIIPDKFQKRRKKKVKPKQN